MHDNYYPLYNINVVDFIYHIILIQIIWLFDAVTQLENQFLFHLDERSLHIL